MKRKLRFLAAIGAIALIGFGSVAVAQRGRGRGAGGGAARAVPGDVNDVRIFGNSGTPEWEVSPHFKSDVFTFVRIQYDTNYGRSGYGRESWSTDAPDSDENFSFRLQQMTSLKVQPHGRILRITDEELFDYPFIYMLEIQRLVFSEEEVVLLRQYLLNGGFLMVDDHWGDAAYMNIRNQLQRVLPGHEPRELPLEHPIFHCVFDLKAKPQIPGIEAARRFRGTNRTWEHDSFQGDPNPHYRAIYDDKGRIVVLICSNTDLGDGWEREGQEEWYFRQFSEKLAYPMGINIVFWAMTH